MTRNGKRVIIVTDLEGVAGVLDSENWCLGESRYFDQAKDLLTAEVNAAVDGFLAAGAEEILVVDGHGCGGIHPSRLHPAAELARNWPAGRAYPFSMDDRPFDYAAWVGQHPKAGTVGGHLCHTGNMGVIDLTINGVSVGEFGELALCAGELGIRSIFAAGCEAFAREAREFVPGIETAVVKRGTQTDPGESLTVDEYRRHNTAAIHRSPEEARRRIREGVRAAMLRARAEPFGLARLPPPYEARVGTRRSADKPGQTGTKQHPVSVSALLNLPWQFGPPRRQAAP
jgi:D-amino peptidase